MKSIITNVRSNDLVGAAAGAAILLALSAGPAGAQVAGVITVAGPSEGASGYVIATGYSKAITDHTPITKVIVQPFAGAEAWPTRMQRGEVNFGQHCGFKQVMEAYHGEGVFKEMGPMRNVRNASTAYGLPYTIHAVPSDIKTISDLKGHALFVQPSHTDLYNAIKLVLKEHGLTLGKDVKELPFRSPTEAIQGLLTGRGDAMAYGAIPGLAEVERAKGVTSLPIPPDVADKVYEAEPIWGKRILPKGFGPTKPEQDVPVLELECGLAAGAQTSADTVYQVMKAIFEHDEWKDVHPLAKQWTLEKASEIFVVPFHDGAVRYYKEKGVWTDEMEKKQQALLSK